MQVRHWDGTGDDTTGAPDDEDGVAFPSPLMAGAATTVSVTASAAGTLDYFFDFDGSGVFGDAAGEVFAFAHPGGVAVPVPVTVPVGATIGGTYARFRLSTAGGLGPGGTAANGEVEDYAVTIVAPTPTLDYGDAPDTYLTSLAAAGASHTAAGLTLGTARDAELDASAPLDGTGDDTTGAPDDEDGVTLPQSTHRRRRDDG